MNGYLKIKSQCLSRKAQRHTGTEAQSCFVPLLLCALVPGLFLVAGGLASALVAGCRQQARQEDLLACGPDVETLIVRADYMSRALQATGGLEGWKNIRKIALDCVVTLYEPDGSFYLTEHRFEVYPWSNSIKITAREPLNRFIWQLSGGQFRVLQGNEREDVSPMAGSYHDLAEAVLNITTAPVRYLDRSFKFSKMPEPVKMEGLWYQPIQRTWLPEQAELTLAAGRRAATEQKTMKPGEPRWPLVVFYQNEQNDFVEIIWFADVAKQRFLAVRGYDYEQVANKGVLVPTKIELFRTDARAVFKQRLAKLSLSLRQAQGRL